MAEAQQDHSGFIEIRHNKLTKPGVFQYLGKEIGATDPDAIYNVYRPKEELLDPECIDSFKLMPWVIEHDMLGKKYNLPAEQKGIHGVVGEEIYYDESDDFLKGNIKIFSDTLEKAITNDIDELSLGFACEYDFSQSGEYEGQPYNVVQRKIRGNHLASVENSRMDIAVMDHATAQDHLTVTLQPNEGNPVDKKTVNNDDKDNKPAEGTGQDADMTMNDMMAMMKEMMPMMQMMQKFMASMNGMNGDGDMDMNGDYAMNEDMPDDDGMDQDKDDKEAMDQDKDEKSGMDSNTTDKATKDDVKLLMAEIKQLKRAQSAAMDTASFLGEISKRDALAARLSHFVGTFDHSSLNLQTVAEYGVEKLEVPCEKGEELSAITAYLHKRTPPSQAALYAINTGTGQDGNTVDDPVDNFIRGGDK